MLAQKSTIKCLVWFALLWGLGSQANYALTDAHIFVNSQQARRFQALTQSIRCVVCQNQSLADSDALLAKDLRRKIDSLLRAGKTDREIKAYFVQRYGQFILFEPPINKTTGLLWFFPLLLLFGAGLPIYVKIKGQSSEGSQST